YVRPQVTVPAAYKETAAPAPGWTHAQPDDSVLRGPWWKAFGDTQLNTLEDQVNVSNQSIQKAVAMLDQARSSVAFARSGYAPTVSASAVPSRTRYSNNLVYLAKSGK